MFGSSNKSSDEVKSSTPTSPGSGSLNALAKGTSMEGTLNCENDMRIDGSVKGKIICKAKLIIGPGGAIDGEAHCQSAVIEGKFKGILKVTDLLNVRESAEVEGDITTNKLLVQSGARFNVSCKMESGAANGALKSGNVNTSNDASKIAGGKTEIRN